MTLFKKKYRVESARVPGRDYASPGLYLITICTKNREPFFGMCKSGIMTLSTIGNIIADEWTQTYVFRPYIEPDEWVVMPDHIHMIIRILPHFDGDGRDDVIARVETPRWGVSTMIATTPKTPIATAREQWKPHSIGSIINQFKSRCTKRIWNAGFRHFAWQPRFHDRIIRDECALDAIREYIRRNPENWNTP